MLRDLGNELGLVLLFTFLGLTFSYIKPFAFQYLLVLYLGMPCSIWNTWCLCTWFILEFLNTIFYSPLPSWLESLPLGLVLFLAFAYYVLVCAFCLYSITNVPVI